MFQQNPHFCGTRHALQRYSNPAQSRALLDRMANRCVDDPIYRRTFTSWLTQGGTLTLRELCAPFGAYQDDLAFRNLVDSIDSAHLHRFEDLPQG